MNSHEYIIYGAIIIYNEHARIVIIPFLYLYI